MAYEEGCIHFKARQRDQLTDITVLQEIVFYLSGLYDNILNWEKVTGVFWERINEEYF